MMRNMMAGLAALVLSGCVLQSETPLFGDDQAVLLFGAAPRIGRTFRAEAGKWVSDNDPPVRLTAEANHYLLPDPDAPDDPAQAMRLYFLPLGGARYGVELIDTGGVAYGVATWDGAELLASSIDCDDLAANRKARRFVTIRDDQCRLRRHPGKAQAVYAALAPEPLEPGLRLVFGR